MSESMRTTARHYALFRAEVLRCLRRYRVTGWRIEFKHQSVDARAEFRGDTKCQVAVFVLGADWQTTAPTDKLIRDTARHEAIHLLLDPLHDLAIRRFVTEHEATNTIESMVRRFSEILP